MYMCTHTHAEVHIRENQGMKKQQKQQHPVLSSTLTKVSKR